jgi:hypothetical protein
MGAKEILLVFAVVWLTVCIYVCAALMYELMNLEVCPRPWPILIAFSTGVHLLLLLIPLFVAAHRAEVGDPPCIQWSGGSTWDWRCPDFALASIPVGLSTLWVMGLTRCCVSAMCGSETESVV